MITLFRFGVHWSCLVDLIHLVQYFDCLESIFDFTCLQFAKYPR